MIKNHISEILPKVHGTEVPLDAPISVKFDQNVATLDTSKLFQVKNGSAVVTGVTVYDANTR